MAIIYSQNSKEDDRTKNGGGLSAAIEFALKAISIATDNTDKYKTEDVVQYRDTLAAIYLELGDIAKANDVLEEIKKEIEKFKKNTEVYDLASAYLKLRKTALKTIQDKADNSHKKK